MNLLAFASSDRGQRREGNEDQYLIDQSLGLFIVCDGMGGHAAGEVASQRSVHYAAEHLRKRRHLLDTATDSPDGFFRVLELAEEATREASRRLYELACSNSEQAGMGTTMTMLLVVGDKAVMTHVGDSRLYILRGKRIHQLSSDHTLAEELVQVGRVSRTEAEAKGFDHVLTRTVGGQKSVEVESLLFDLFPGDTCLLCSDGLSNYFVDRSEIIPFLERDDLATVPEELVALANSRGGADNITAVVVRPETGSGRDAAIETQLQLDMLKQTFLCRKFTVRRLMHIVNVATVLTYGPGQSVLDDGQSCEGFHILLQGRVRVDDDPVLSGELLPGDCFGETCLLHAGRHPGNLVAEEPTRMLFISRDAFAKLTRRLPKLGNALLRNLGKQLSMDLEAVQAGGDPDPGDTILE